MRFEKGISGNPGGRPKGAKNKVTKDIGELVQLLVTANMDKLQADIESLSPNDRVKAITALLGYVLPKQQAVQANIGNESDDLNFSIRIYRSNGDEEQL